MINNPNTTSNISNRKELQQKIAQESMFNSLVANRTHQQIDPPKGRLVRQYDPISGSFVAIKDMGKDVVNIGKAFTKGEGNDHSLGRMNDIGLKLGGIGIAAYLQTKIPTKTGKIMEFVGFGAFLASMKLWPTLFIDLPTQLAHGFNPRQKFIDSQGRKKEFFQDNQYQPWDLYTSEQLNKVGDRLGVPKDMADREEFTKKKMRTIALQDNTLWMMTAGLATPLMTSMLCTWAQPRIKDKVIEKTHKKTLGDVKNLKEVADKLVSDKSFDKKGAEFLNSQLNTLGSEKPAAGFFANLANFLTPVKMNKETAVDLETLYNNVASRPVVNDEDFLKGLKGLFKEYGMDDLSDITDLKTLQSELNIKSLTPEGITGFLKEESALKSGHEALIKGFFGTTAQINDNFKTELKNLYHNAEKGKGIREIKAQINVLAKATNALAGNKAESKFTKAYLSISKTLYENTDLKEEKVKFTDHIKNAFKAIRNGKISTKAQTFSSEDAFNALRKNMINVGSDQKKLDDFIKKFIAEYLDADAATKTIKDQAKNLQTSAGALGDEFANLKTALGEKGFVTSTFGNMIDLGQDNIDSLVSKIITWANFERKVAKGEIKATPEMLEIYRKVMGTGTMSDFQNKNYLDHSKVDFTEIMTNLFKSKLDKDTEDAFKVDLSPNAQDAFGKNKSLLERLQNFRESTYATANAADARNAAHHKLPDAAKVMGPEKNYIKVGQSLADNLRDSVKRASNDKTWMRIFGTLSVVLVVGTLIAQTFFGKVKDEQHYLKGAQDASK